MKIKFNLIASRFDSPAEKKNGTNFLNMKNNYKIIVRLIFIVTPITADKNYSDFISEPIHGYPKGKINYPTGNF